MPQRMVQKLKQLPKWTAISVLTGVLAGAAAALFLYLLDWATRTRDAHHVILWLLPLAGFAIGWIFLRFGQNAEAGNSLVIDEIHNPQRLLPLRMVPLILGGTVITHLFGGSAGREGTAVQMGAALSDQLSRLFKLNADGRKILLVAGAGAGFGAAVGAPLAGAFFGMEVISIRRLKLFAPLECLVASYVAFYIAELLRAPHSIYPFVTIPNHNLSNLFYVLIAGLIFGLAAQLFIWASHAVEHFQKKWVRYPPARPLIAGLILSPCLVLPQFYPYAGLGISVIQKALHTPPTFAVPFIKIFFTALTIGSGFKGGEFIPMVFIGTTLGSALSTIFPVSTGLLAAVGFAAVFGAGANTPIACTVMAMEIFGPKIGVFAAVGCFAAYYISGHHGIYKTQRLEQSKRERLKRLFRL